MPDFLPSSGAGDAVEPGVLGGHLLAQGLADAGVDTLFTLCGGHILPLLDGWFERGLRCIDHRHEGAATLAAEGYALATGRTGVAAITAGPGFANGFIGLADAGMWSVPLVVVAGHTGIPLTGRGAVQDLPQAAIASTVAKRVLAAGHAGRVGELAAEAVYIARSGKPGPVYLEVPQDLMAGSVPEPPVAAGFPDEPPAAAAPADVVERLVEVLAGARKPVVLAGGGCFWSGAGDALRRFCEVAAVPVTTNSAARGVVPDSHHWCLGTMVHGGGAVLTGDVVVVLGSEFNANVNMGRPPLFPEGGDQVVIQVDVRAESMGGNRRPDLAVVGDVRVVLEQLLEAWPEDAVDREERESWLGECKALATYVRSTWDEQIENHEGSRLHAGGVVRDVVTWSRERLGAGVSFVADGGDALTWGLAYMYAEEPGRVLHTTTALGTLGVGLPFAVAAQVARPEERTVLFVGDGAFGFSAMEFDTMVRHGLPVIVIVSNNFGWRDVSFEQDAWFGAGRHIATELADTRYDKLAEALGGHGEWVRTDDELRPALDRCLDQGVPSIVNVETDPSVISDLLRNLGTMGIQ